MENSKLKAMMQIELTYQLECHLKKNNLSSTQFSCQNNISMRTVLRILGKKKITLPELNQICNVLQITFESLRKPNLDGSLKLMVNQLRNLSHHVESSGDNSYIMDFIESMRALPQEDIARNTAWLSYYNDLLIKQNPSKIYKLPQLHAAFVDEISNQETYKNIAESLKKEREKLE